MCTGTKASKVSMCWLLRKWKWALLGSRICSAWGCDFRTVCEPTGCFCNQIIYRYSALFGLEWLHKSSRFFVLFFCCCFFVCLFVFCFVCLFDCFSFFFLSFFQHFYYGVVCDISANWRISGRLHFITRMPKLSSSENRVRSSRSMKRILPERQRQR